MVLIIENRKELQDKQERKMEHEQKGGRRTESKVVIDGGQDTEQERLNNNYVKASEGAHNAETTNYNAKTTTLKLQTTQR